MSFDLIIYSGEAGINNINDNVDVEIIMTNGDRYYATFFTIENIRGLLEKYKTTGECADGLYFWSSNMIIVNNLSKKVIKDTVDDLIKTGEIYQACSR